MSSILTGINDNEYSYDKRIHMKGASEYIVERCSHYIDENGDRKELTADIKEIIL
jgi:hypothetical protein